MNDCKKTLNDVSLISYFLWFPGHFFYQYLISIELIPPFLGSYLPLVSIFLLVALSFFNLKNKIELNFSGTRIFFLVLLHTSLCAATYFIFHIPELYYKELFIWTCSGIVYNLVCFFISSKLDFYRNKKYHFYLLMIMSAIVMLYTNKYWNLEFGYSGENVEFIANYQSHALIIFTASLIFFASYIKHTALLFFGTFTGIVALYFCGARTEFVLFLISISFLLLQSYRTLPNKFIVVTLTTIFFVVLLLTFLLFPSERMFNLLNVTKDYSVISRIEFNRESINSIIENPILGNYGAYASDGGIGTYPHNILLAWQNLGLIGFLLYCILFLVLWKELIKCYRTEVIRDTFIFRLFFMLLISSTVALLFAKNYSYPLVGFLIGIYDQLMRQKQRFSHNSYYKESLLRQTNG
ncbi:MAG: hypothetical protein AXW14_13410 [Alteromonas sp. Nap_26]|nr:MAG: hypothetical protein AXW14_13410 [Alteromonas sp. Nap_26]